MNRHERRSRTDGVVGGWTGRHWTLFSPLALGLLLALPSGCGKSGPPLPPLRLTPEAPSELRLAQRGDRIELTCRAPRASADGARLGVLDLQLFTATGEADPIKTAVPRQHRVAPGEALSETMQPLPAPGTALHAAARARLGKRVSAPTPVVTLTVQAPLPAPAQLRAERATAGVQLRWKPVRDATAGALRYWVYRRTEKGTYAAALNGEPTADASFADTGSEADAGACYVVRSVASVDPVIESASSVERCLTPRPPAPPPTPRGLLAVPDGSAVELSWTCATEASVLAYRVYRAEGEGRPQLRQQVAAGHCSYRDENVPVAVVLKYSLTSVDAGGAESSPAFFGALRPRGQ